MKKKTVSKLKKDLDAVFSKYIRQKYSDGEEVTCYTCGLKRPIKNMQNGHFVPRQYLATRFDERNVRPQCYACNMLYNGQPSTFAKKLEQETPGLVAELDKLRHKITKLDTIWYEEKIQEYKDKLSALL